MASEKNTLLVVLLNGTPMLEYNRDRALSPSQEQSLKLMSEKLDQGFDLGNQHVDRPKLEQKIEFVTANLVSAMLNDKETLAAASCAYLAHALPELKQVKAIEVDGEISIELIFDREFQAEEKLNFTPLEEITQKPH